MDIFKNEYILNDAPPPTPDYEEIEFDNIYYNCADCTSLIEILSVNEENNMIKYKCINKNELKIMKINEYLEKMKQYNNNQLNKDKCEIHNNNNNYVSYCFDCKHHLCTECLQSRVHIDHIKNNIIEIQPLKEEIEIMKEIINDYKFKIKNLKIEKTSKMKELYNSLNNNKIKENKRIEEIMKKNKIKQEEELKNINDKYLSEIEEIRNKYEQEIKVKNDIFRDNTKKINNKYKLLYEKENIFYKTNIEKINQQYIDKYNKLNYDEKIENNSNILRLSELIYKAYINNNNNYFNAININNILLILYKNEYIKNNIMNKIIKKYNDKNIKIIFEIKNNDIKYEKKLLNDNNIEVNKIIEQYEKKIKLLKEENEKHMMIYESKIIRIVEDYEAQIREIKEEQRNYIKKFEENKKKNKEKNNEISIIYKINKNDNIIKIFNPEFVNNNKTKCKIKYDEKEYELQEEFNIKNITKNKEILEIKLIGIMNITNMYAMFYGCSSLICLPDIDKWDTSNVTDMSCIFGECCSLISLPDISKWNTSKVINMHSMFYKCYSLLYLPDISNWITTNVTDLHGMFSECSSLLYIPDISKWDTRNVVTASKMFKKCSSLLSLPDISKWNTSNMCSLNEMFEGCSKSLNISQKIKK